MESDEERERKRTRRRHEEERNKNFLGSVPRLSVKRSPRAREQFCSLSPLLPSHGWVKASSTTYEVANGNRDGGTGPRRDRREFCLPLMETRSWRAASRGGKTDLSAPTFLPASLSPAVLALYPSRNRDPLPTLFKFVPDSPFSLSVPPSPSLPPLYSVSYCCRNPRADPRVRIHRGSCLTREYFTFPCCHGEENEGSSRPRARCR